MLSEFWLKIKMNILNYLSKRSINGQLNNSKHFTDKLFDTAKDLYKKDLVSHFGCVNAIEFSSDGKLLFSGGDDRRVLMWNVNDAMMYYTGKMGEGAKPFIMKGCHYSNIFCLAVDSKNKRVLSGSNDDQVIIHDFITGNLVDVFLHDSPVFSLSLHPANGNIFASAADNGLISLYDVRQSSSDLFCVAKLETPFHGVMFNPCEPLLLATANSKLGIHIWDLRKPKEILIKCNDEPSMAVRWNQNGTILLALRNLLPMVIYDPLIPTKKLEFDSGTYFNACTMKSCSFAGANDEYILSGSDDFNLYMWKIPNPWPDSKWIGSEHLVLTGHRSIVNQVRYSSSMQLIATSGVEKIIKIWSPFRLPYSEGDLDKESEKRYRVLCSARSCMRSPGFLSHDYTQESVEEDSRMIHFFDSLLQNELDDTNSLSLSQSCYLGTSVFTPSNNKKEARVYEKLIKKKKKYLSELLIRNSESNNSACSLDRKSNEKRFKLLNFNTSDNQYSSTSEGSEIESYHDLEPMVQVSTVVQKSMEGVSANSSINNSSLSSVFSSSSSPSKAKLCNKFCKDSLKISSKSICDIGICSSSQSKLSFEINFSESDDSVESWSSNFSCNAKQKTKDSEGNISKQIQSDSIFKSKRSKFARNYRRSLKKKNKIKQSNSNKFVFSKKNKLRNQNNDLTNTKEGPSCSLINKNYFSYNNEKKTFQIHIKNENSSTDNINGSNNNNNKFLKKPVFEERNGK